MLSIKIMSDFEYSCLISAFSRMCNRIRLSCFGRCVGRGLVPGLEDVSMGFYSVGAI